MPSLKNMQIEDIENGISDLKKITEDFREGKISVKDYKGLSGKYGTFGERGKKKNMVRLRNSCGIIHPKKLRFVVDEAKKYGIEDIHFATCQTIQFHHCDNDTIYGLLEDAADNGFLTYGTGGNYPRNIMCSPLSGIDPDEVMDVLPYAEIAAEYLTSQLEDPQMPKKLKTAFSGDRHNITHATYRDLGFVAQPDGTFDVYTAGGLGPNPKFGVKTAEHIPPEEILYYIQAMVDTFKKYGNAKDKSKSRTRYMVENLGGEENYIAAYNRELERIKNEKNLMIHKEDLIRYTKKGDGSIPDIDHWRVHPQKEEGLYYVEYHPIGGNPSIDTLEKLADAIEQMDQVEVRTGPDQTAYVINLTGEEADRILEITEEDAAKNEFETSTCCVGASTCQVGIRNSQALLHDLIDKVREADIKFGCLPKLHISGCPSSCSGHQTAEIGMQGTIKMVDHKINPAFIVSIHGKNRQFDSVMGKKAGVMLLKNIPDFLIALGKEVEKSGLNYQEWEAKFPTRLDEIAAEYVEKD